MIREKRTREEYERFSSLVDKELATIEGELQKIKQKHFDEGWFYQPSVKLREGPKNGFYQITLESTAVLHNFDHTNPKQVRLVQPWLGSEVSVWTKMLPQGNKTFLTIRVGVRLAKRPSEMACLHLYDEYNRYLLSIRDPLLTNLAKTVKFTLIGNE